MFVCMFFKLLAFPSILPSLQSNDNSLPINLFFIQLFLYYHNLKYTISNLSFFYNPILNSIIPIITTMIRHKSINSSNVQEILLIVIYRTIADSYSGNDNVVCINNVSVLIHAWLNLNTKQLWCRTLFSHLIILKMEQSEN